MLTTKTPKTMPVTGTKAPTLRPTRSTKRRVPTPALEAPMTVSVPGGVLAVEPAPVSAPVSRPTMPARPGRSLADRLGAEVRRFLKVHARRPYGTRGQLAIDRLILSWREALGAGADDELARHPQVSRTCRRGRRRGSLGETGIFTGHEHGHDRTDTGKGDRDGDGEAKRRDEGGPGG